MPSLARAKAQQTHSTAPLPPARSTRAPLALVRELAQPEPVEPVLKWAGGKTRLLPELVKRLPASFMASQAVAAVSTAAVGGTRARRAKAPRYFEPFAGGAALFFHMRPRHATLTDCNEELIHLYRVVRDDVEGLIEELSQHPHDRTHYYSVRAQNPREMAPTERAARMVFLNRTCFNGLWRVNKRGEFNVPFGSYTNPTICPEDRLRAASRALAGVSLEVMDFEAATRDATAGDFVYFDPPYVPLTRTANFTAYTGLGFGLPEQERLADLFTRLTDRGVHCMLSNSDTPLVRELYAGHRIERVLAPRSISRDATRRDAVGEVIVTNA